MKDTNKKIGTLADKYYQLMISKNKEIKAKPQGEMTEEQKENTNNILKKKTQNLMISKNLKSKYILLNPIYKKGIKHTKITENEDETTDDETTDNKETNEKI